jgi:CubicO group peptidase (beta-lactamase class C family)
MRWTLGQEFETVGKTEIKGRTHHLTSILTRRHSLALGAGAVLLGAASALTPADVASSTRTRRVVPPPEPFPGLSAWLENQRAGWGVPGLAVAMIKGGQMVYASGFGHRDAARTRPVTQHTLFRGASTTKALGAASVAALVDDGKLNWNAPVTCWLPELRLSGGEEYRSVNLIDMLSHRTGLPRHDLVWYNNTKLTREGLLARMPHLAMTAPLRARYQYNNLMYILAGLAVERASGQSWEAFTTDRLLKPLGMTRTNLSALDMARDSDHAIGHAETAQGQIEAVPLRHDALLGPAGALNASVTDYAQWALMLLGQGSFNGKTVLSKAAMAALWEPMLLTSGTPQEPEFERGYYGLGWRIDRYRDTVRIAHGGDLNGFTSRVVLLPQLGAGLIVLVNHGGHPLPNAVTPDLLDRLMGRTPEDHAGKVLARRRPVTSSPTPAAKPPQPPQQPTPTDLPKPASRPLGHFAGLYRHGGYGEFSVGETPNGLTAQYNDMPAQLAHRLYDVFEVQTPRLEHGDFNGLRLAFQSDDEGRIMGFTARMQDGVAPIVFAKVS